jgi:hypothetical protein
MLADLPGQGAAIGLGHPVLGLDEVVGRDPRLERFEELGSSRFSILAVFWSSVVYMR